MPPTPAPPPSSPSTGVAFAGWERADSIVVNPHKWWFTPLDASLLLTRRMAELRAAFSLVPEYLRTLDRAAPVRDVSEYTPQLGRRFRALKLWVQLRWFGLDGLRRRIRHHVELARRFAEWVDADPDWERLAPVPFSTVCFRWRPADRPETEASAADLDAANERILAAVNSERRGLPLPHPPRRTLHPPPRRRQSPDRGAARGAGLGPPPRGRGRRR
ncbi:MAG: hypothetical protein KatS3mg065_0392 [Chloroflexota bacterium]|nr:MAG: hypothetical protein KatS3mg065_0392 [Chloroflexota bacterium]